MWNVTFFVFFVFLHDVSVCVCDGWQIPNGLGTLFAIVQLVLYATFYKSTQRQLAEGKRKGDGLTEVVVMGDARKVGNAPIYNNRTAEIRET